MKQSHFPTLVVFIGLNLFLFSLPPADAQQTPNIKDIVASVAKVTLPTQSYTASVHQVVSHAESSKSASPNVVMVQTNEIEESDFTINCETSGAVHVTKGVALKSMSQNTSISQNATSPIQNKRLMLTMNPLNALLHVEKLPSSEIADDSYQDIPCYKIFGTDQGFTFVSWINKTNSCICHQIILHGSETIFDSQFEYKKVKNCYVPLRVVITKPSNGMRIEQQFSGHSL